MDIIEKISGFAFIEEAIYGQSTVFQRKPIWPKRTQKCFIEIAFFVCNIIETLWCYKWTLLNSLEICLVKLQFLGKSQCFYGTQYGLKEHKNDEMFLSTLFLKHASPMRCVLFI